MFGYRREKLLENPRLLGIWGQKRCEKLLKKKGLKTLTRNFSCRTGEIDLVMLDSSGAVVFVEVKTRANEDFADAESSVTASKKARIQRAAHYFLLKHHIADRPCRFDVTTVVLNKTGAEQITHYQNAFSTAK